MIGARQRDLLTVAVLALLVAGLVVVVLVVLRQLPFLWWGLLGLVVSGASALGVGLLTGPGTDDDLGTKSEPGDGSG